MEPRSEDRFLPYPVLDDAAFADRALQHMPERVDVLATISALDSILSALKVS
jgi:hypothetical protein